MGLSAEVRAEEKAFREDRDLSFLSVGARRTGGVGGISFDLRFCGHG